MFETFATTSRNSKPRVEAFTKMSVAISKFKIKGINHDELKILINGEIEKLATGLQQKNIGIRKFIENDGKGKKECQLSNYLLGNKADAYKIRPIVTSADGNCLFNAISTLLYAKESFEVELRMRAVIDLILNFESYLDINSPSEEFFKFAFHTSGHETQSSCEGILINEIHIENMRVIGSRDLVNLLMQVNI